MLLRRGALVSMKINTRIHKLAEDIFAFKKVSTIHDYDTYWRLREVNVFRIRFEQIARLISSNSTVLDLGCGDGELGRYLNTKLRINYYGVDTSLEAVRLAKKKGLNVNVLDITDCIKLKRLLSKIKPDYVVLSEIIEHIPNTEDVLRTLSEGMVYMIISFPNTGYFIHRIRLLFGKFPVQWAFFPSEHIRFWTLLDFDHLLQTLNLTVENRIPVSGIRYFMRFFPNLFVDQVIYLIKSDNKWRP